MKGLVNTMSEHGHRSSVHDKELRKFEDAREAEYNMERKKAQSSTAREQKKEADRKKK